MGENSRVVLDSQRKLARVILASLVIAVVTLVLVASGPSLGLSFAQQQQPQIEFLNPSGTNFSKEVSAKPDGRDSAYHLVAWANPLPDNASVQFRYLDPDSNQEVTIATASQTGIPDTFHALWQPPASLPEEEEITLYAILFSGSTEVDRDTEDEAFYNNEDPDPDDPTDDSEPAGETVEITYPAVGGAWGLFTPRDRATAGVINVSHSEGVQFIRVVYSVSAPGTEPIWTTCGTERAADVADGVRCTLSSTHSRNQVTAVGAIANDTPPPPTPVQAHNYNASRDDSGDAHRVQPYAQVPGTVTVDPTSQSGATVGECSVLFTSTLTDQFGISIPNANMDVHARGPGEDTAFDDGTTASANKAPDQGGHSTEAARVCSEDPPGTGGQQGRHADVALLDIKHVESSVAAGTSDAGRWSFQLFSPQAGTTEFVVWSDLDDDDQFCSEEKNAAGSVGWGQGAGTSSIGPDVTSCPPPSESPLPGPSTPGPTPTDTGSPDPRGCTITGTDDGEAIVGTQGDDVICALGGADVVKGLGGNDTIYGDAGRDDLRGGSGDDTIHGGGGKDQMRGKLGDDDLFGGGGNDVIAGGDGNDTIAGNAGFDAVRGGRGNDTVRGHRGSDNVTGGPGRDSLFGNRGRDSLIGGPGRDLCVGGRGRDSFSGCERRRR